MKRKTKENRKRPLTFQHLEAREVFTGLTATFANGVLTIVGTEKADKIEVFQAQGKISVSNAQITQGGKRYSGIDANLVNRVEVQGRGGNDMINLASAKGIVGKPAIIDAGAGNDTVVGGFGSDAIYGGLGND